MFDPLCGWCYGAAPALRRLAALPGIVVALAPTGLFAGAGARPMTDAFADYAWSNDQRIQKLTGQPFTDQYRDAVLSDRVRRFDSGPATLALAAVASTEPEREIDALSAIQTARYVDGRDVTAAATLAQLLDGLGLAVAARLIATPTDVLRAFNAERVARARADLQSVGAQGVPALIVEDDGGRRTVDSGILFAGPDRLAAALAAA
ncbi:protein-disulfide isomerase [Rhodoplanes roseus]|uniref:Protein-disulfide isomerase n=1 Tax=Rhodoplanes roseus TaxID=29409 RepID=A0A327KN67_9BRAD|nr:protein-disulfide isomerase [Rhodoplanes roseus]